MSFTGQIIQYIKGKPTSNAIVKEGILQKGKIRIENSDGAKELERNNKWILLKIYDKEGKLLQSSQILEENIANSFSFDENSVIIWTENLYENAE